MNNALSLHWLVTASMSNAPMTLRQDLMIDAGLSQLRPSESSDRQ